MTPAEVRARVLEFTRRPVAAVAALEDPDGKGALLLEPGTAKELRLRWDEVARRRRDRARCGGRRTWCSCSRTAGRGGWPTWALRSPPARSPLDRFPVCPPL